VKTGGDIFSTGSAILLVLVTVVLPFASYYFLCKNIEKLKQNQEFYLKYNQLAPDSKLRGFADLSYTFIFMTRRIVFVVSVVYLPEYPIF
jgi:hypothetical protein